MCTNLTQYKTTFSLADNTMGKIDNPPCPFTTQATEQLFSPLQFLGTNIHLVFKVGLVAFVVLQRFLKLEEFFQRCHMPTANSPSACFRAAFFGATTLATLK
jgi:hypothetical protein